MGNFLERATHARCLLSCYYISVIMNLRIERLEQVTWTLAHMLHYKKKKVILH